MNLKDKMKKFNQRWGIENDESYEESFKKFKTRILNIMKDIDSKVTEKSISEFCRFYGIPEHWEYARIGDGKWSENIINRLIGENDEKEFYKLLEVIFALDILGLRGYGGRIEYSKETIYGEVCQAINWSNVNVATAIIKEGEIIFYPSGEELLDEDIVNQVLSFLNQESNTHFKDALKFYKDKKWVKCSESLRRAAEEFIRFKLNNKNGLAANISEIGKWLKNEKAPAQARNIVSQTLGYLDQLFNENSKHNDGDLGEEDAEFLIYQVGLILRFIEKHAPKS